MSIAAETLEIPVKGMTCGHCVETVRKALEGVPGVREARVDLEAGKAEVTFEPDARVGLDRLRSAVEAVGYSVPEPEVVPIGATPGPPTPAEKAEDASPAAQPAVEPEAWDLAIGGMHCASCVVRVESALSSVPGVKEARVNLATERASVLVDPESVDEARLAEAVAKAGYTAKRAEIDPSQGAESLRKERAEHVAYWRNRLIVGVALTVPLAVLGMAPMLGFFRHAAWVGWAMFALATPLQLYLGAPYYRGAWMRLKQGSSNMDTLIAVGSTTAFGYSLYFLLAGRAHEAHVFLEVASVVFAATLSYLLIKFF